MRLGIQAPDRPAPGLVVVTINLAYFGTHSITYCMLVLDYWKGRNYIDYIVVLCKCSH